MPRIIPNLWFDDDAHQAAEFYVSIFPNSRITRVLRYGEGGMGEPGAVMTVDFELDGQPFTAINGGPRFRLDEAVSLLIPCADEDEQDHDWSALTDGGEESMCGWLRDRFGLSWQVFPVEAGELLGDPDPGRAERAMAALLTMRRIDVASLRRAADGDGDG